MYSPLVVLGIVFVVAIVNLALGFFLARWQVFAPRGEREIARAKLTAAPAKSAAAQPSSKTASEAEPAGAQAESPEPQTLSEVTSEAEPPADSAEGDAAASEPEVSPPVAIPGSRLEAIAGFRGELLANRRGLLLLDGQLRSSRLSADPPMLAEATSTIRQTVRSFVSGRDALIDQLPSKGEGTEDAAAACCDLILAADTRTIQSSKTLAMLEEVETLEDSPHEALERILVEVARLIHTGGQLIETIEESLLAVAREEYVLTALSPRITQPAAGLGSMLGLAMRLAEHEQLEGVREQDALSLTVWDVDGTAKLNDHFGPAVVERALLTLGGIIKDLAPEGAKLARVSGQRYAMLVAVDVEEAASIAERVRQTVEASQILAEGEEVALTLSSGVVARQTGEAYESLMERAAAALAEAKQYGRNRTFLHDDDYPAPVLPPELELAPQSIEATALSV